jgi:hypothetical protein
MAAIHFVGIFALVSVCAFTFFRSWVRMKNEQYPEAEEPIGPDVDWEYGEPRPPGWNRGVLHYFHNGEEGRGGAPRNGWRWIENHTSPAWRHGEHHRRARSLQHGARHPSLRGFALRERWPFPLSWN